MPELTPLAQSVAEKLKRREETISITESSTGGLISAALLAIPGASAYFMGGSVVYTLPSRKKILGITRADVEGMEPLTSEMVSAFAQKARAQLETAWAIAELGVAGPTGARYGHPPGLSVLAIDGPVQLTKLVETGSADREENMWAFTQAALELLDEALSQA
ncbi:MAG: nicotinamide-nucleotide amidohydrolase family protein [Pseudomonadales bacterium]|nr:nicotinamide-nucleotide amidohydrolase family protein [Pseudomonadales bacterium]